MPVQLRLRPLAAVVAGSTLLTLATEAPRPARAAWPPPRSATSADLKDPANWPNDPEYGYATAVQPRDRTSGLWQWYSFIPDRSPGAPALRPEETASGMSVDLAWRHTTGRDDVLIAVLDSGINWDSADLLDRAYLNLGELTTHQPTQADGSPCGGTGSVAGFDCNGDGIASISDWADSVWLEPPATDGRPLGDANRNGVFDAGDLVIMRTAAGTLIVSDGIDDDNNGYVDDVSGWDFFKDDNDAYDDTRYGHGTGEANDSTGAANNGISGIGGCPGCRFLPVRVGDSFIANVQDFAQGVIFATDSGAKVVQEALGTINMSSFAQSALDYAWARGTLVVASMADENSRHHNVPAAANHTMPVHAITMHGVDQQSTTAQSFLHFNTCTNFGAQNFLSASGTGCSSEAVGRTSGISGLLFSASRDAGMTPPLTAGEAMQVFLGTADDIDVAGSGFGESPYFHSQPGFDQRFGYGRVNANSAVEAILAGAIPPDVDVVRPYWFEVIHADRVSGPTPILGTVSAKRANSYDYVVEWAPGVQPLDDAFQTITELSNVASSVVSGADGEPLAELDVRGLDVGHERDPDSQLGENDFTITVRIRATAHYGGSIGDVTGELRRAYYVHEDPDLVDGFPVYLGGSGESSPKLADIDGDGIRDVVSASADGEVHVLSVATGRPESVVGFPFRTKRVDGLDGAAGSADYSQSNAFSAAGGVDPASARETIVSSPAIADLDGDGRLDIVVTSYEGTIFAVGNDGALLPGFPVGLPRVPSCPLDDAPRPALCMDTRYRIARGAFASPVLEDMDGDGALEIVQAAFDGFVHILRSDGTPLDGWPVRIHHPTLVDTEYNRIMTTPAVGDFNDDGIPDVLVGSNERLGKGQGSGGFYLVDGRGTRAPKAYFDNWPVTMTSFNVFPLVAEGVPNSPVVGDMNGDGKLEAVMHGNASAPLIVPGDPGTQRFLGSTPTNAMPERLDFDGNPTRGLEPTGVFGTQSKAQTPDVMFPLFAQPALGDLDQDGQLDITASGASLTVAQNLLSAGVRGGISQQMLSMWNGRTGGMMPGSPVILEDFTFFNNQAIADLNADGYPEVITGSGGYYVHAADVCGREPEGFPKFTGQWIIGTTAVGDIDGDSTLEVVVPTRAGWLYAWHTKGTSDGTIAWESFHHDNRNTGNASVPLEQGKPLGAAQPMEIDADGRCVIPEVTGEPKSSSKAARGGCDCTVPARSGTPLGALGLAGLLVAAARRRRRRLSLA